MPAEVQEQLLNYKREYIDAHQSALVRFEKLRELYAQYIIDEQNLSLMNFGTSLIAEENSYERQKATCHSAHQQLKAGQRSVDERTLKIEQQLYLGLPSDLDEMEKIIVEQESIVQYQQQLNKKEEELLEEMRKIDIDHGKKLALIELEYSKRNSPIEVREKAFKEDIAQQEKKTAYLTRALAFLTGLLVPTAMDLLAQNWGMQKIGEAHLIVSHYVFFIAFILIELFFGPTIRKNLSSGLSRRNCVKMLATIETPWKQARDERFKLEKEYGLTLEQVSAACSTDEPL